MTTAIKFNSTEDHDLYSKSLFKTIFLDELNVQLKLVGLFSESDSYLLKTLKLRRHIIRKSNGPLQLLDSLQKDIQSEKRSCLLYSCCVPGCTSYARNHKLYLLHFKTVHGRSSHKVTCRLYGCTREFSTINALRTHIEIHHQKWRVTAVQSRQNVLVEQLVKLKCLSTACSRQTVSSVAELKKHLKIHFDRFENVSCPFSGCIFQTANNGTMRSHFSKNHKKQDVDSLKEEIVCQDQTAFEDDSVENVRIDEEEPEVVYDAEAGEDDPVTITDDEQDAAEEIDEFFMRSLAVCINTWMNISGIPYSTVNQIVKEIFNSYEKGADVTKSKVKAVLQREGVSVATIDNVLETLESDDPFKKAKNELESEFKRKMYIKEHFANVEPVTVVLSAANEKVESYQYVPIKESLKLLVEDETYIVQRKNDPYCHKEGQIADARDGTKMTNNIFFKQNPEAVPLLIFEDELEVANPLGSAKTKHKINCCYYTTLHVQSALRGRVKSIQLVSLISSKTWKKYGNI